MNKKILYFIIALLVLVIVGGGLYSFLSKQGKQREIAPAASTSRPLSEKPNLTKYNEYLSDIYLGKLAVGKKIGADGFPTRTNVFTKGDQFCTLMTLKKTIPSGEVATAVYDTIAKQDNQPKTVFPIELKAGGTGGCGDLTQSPGSYEYKLYINDVLVSVLPFEVR